MRRILKYFSILSVGEVHKSASSNEDTQPSTEKPDEQHPDELIHRYNVPNTPLTIVTTKGQTFVAMGMYKISENHTVDECLKLVETRDWNLIMNITRLIAMAEINIEKDTAAAIKEKGKTMAMQPNSKKYH